MYFFFSRSLSRTDLSIPYNRSVGGIRISLYNAITEEQTDKVVAYIRQFVEETPVQPPLPSESVNQ